MKKSFFRNHLVIGTLISIICCFFISVLVGQIIGNVVCMALGMSNQTIAGKFCMETMGKIVAIGVAFLFIGISGLFHKIKTEHGHLNKCRFLLLVLFCVAVYNVVGDAMANKGTAFTQFHVDALVACVLYAFTTGILEELVCRVLLFQNMLEKWKDQSHGAFKAVLISSFVFGACHLLNISAGVLPTLFQVYYAVVAGIIFASLYLLGRNIWICIISHFLIDFGGAVGYAFMPNDNAMKLAASMSGIDMGSILVVAVMTVAAIYALVLASGNPTIFYQKSNDTQ